MKRFHFPLERVRRWRSEQASLEELKLEQLRAELSRLGGAKRQVEADAARAAEQVLAQASMDALELISLDSYRLHMRQRVREIEQLELQCEAGIVEQRKRVIEARRQTELLDRLYNKAWDQWSAAGNKEYEDLAAEMFLARSVRNR
ncbi:MAG: hypothetical protein LAP38_01430 [Acidobacteriia bacterium]|nr:hypothetical protein [Terriglobia bacterium]